MFRRIALICLLAASPVPAVAQSVQDQIISQLAAQGFGDFEVTRTLLGRVRILARSGTLRREMVFNPTTGEILRDYWEPLSGDGAVAPAILDPEDDDDNRGRGRGGDDGNEDGDDDRDNSGSGNGGNDDDAEDDDKGNSGSGSGGNDDDDDDKDDEGDDKDDDEDDDDDDDD